MKHAVVLLSGGLDSSTALAWATREKMWHCHTISIDYGQRHRLELEAAQNVANFLSVSDHRLIQADLNIIGGSALTDNIEVPKDAESSSGIPVTYVPARNLIFLSIAIALAETVNACHIVFGANIVDYSGYPDCRPEFIESFAQTARLGTKAGVEGNELSIETPLIDMKKSEIIDLGYRLGLDYGLTRSCYDPYSNGLPCGHCDSCRFRIQAFSETGRTDPLPYP